VVTVKDQKVKGQGHKVTQNYGHESVAQFLANPVYTGYAILQAIMVTVTMKAVLVMMNEAVPQLRPVTRRSFVSGCQSENQFK